MIPTPGKEFTDIEAFRFRGLHPRILLGTASDRYSGWIGQIYTADRYAGKITKRTHTIAGKGFIEEVLPVESVGEYFDHFSILEIDYTFYRPLLDPEGKPTQNYSTLSNYKKYLGHQGRLILKVPQEVFAQKIRQKDSYLPNPSYLNPRTFTDQFYRPANEILGPSLAGFIFEQEYQRSRDRTPLKLMAERLDEFFAAIPPDKRYHLELRTEFFLQDAVFSVLEKHGIGQVLSHWSWLPPLRKQFARADRRFLNSGGEVVVRLMTPIGMTYEKAYELTHPFNQLVEGVLQEEMVEDAVKLMQEGIRKNVRVNVIINNRAGGNAPMIAQRIAKRFLPGMREYCSFKGELSASN